MSVAAVKTVLPLIGNKCLTIYNDNPGAAGAIRTKSPPLARMDLQALIEELAMLAFKNKFYFWGVHEIASESDNMRQADRLSRYEPTQWYESVEKIDILKECNEVFDILWEAPRNLPSRKDISKEIRKEFNIELEVEDYIASFRRVRRNRDTYNILFKQAPQ